MHAKYILNITALYPPQHSHSILFLCKDGAFQRYTCHQFKPYKTNHNQIYSPILSLNCFNNLINNWVNNNKIMQMLNKIFFLSHSTQGLFTTQFNNIWVWTQRFFFYNPIKTCLDLEGRKWTTNMFKLQTSATLPKK